MVSKLFGSCKIPFKIGIGSQYPVPQYLSFKSLDFTNNKSIIKKHNITSIFFVLFQ